MSRARPSSGAFAGLISGSAPAWLYLAVPSIAFLLHSLLFQGWIIDDAGISFAYARSLANGRGLVSQPGVEPLEAYSNFLWVVLLAPFFRLDLFDPDVTPKVLSVALVLVSFYVIYRTMTDPPVAAGRMWAFVALLLLAVTTPFVIWTSSGLENPLYVLVLSLLLYATLRMVRQDATASEAAVPGVLAAAAAMTRPDGIVYCIAFPTILLVWRLWLPAAMPDHSLKKLLVYAATFGVVFGAFIVFRVAYFGELLPHSYDAKHIGLGDLILGLPLQGAKLSYSVFAGPVVFIPLLLAIPPAMRERRPTDVVFAIFVILAAAEFLFLPPDWMREFRFATPFIMLMTVGGTVFAARYLLPGDISLQPTGAKLLFAAFLVGGAAVFAARSSTFSGRPTVPFDRIAEDVAFPFNSYKSQLGIDQGSLMVQDIGAPLYYSDLRVYDLAGLADETTARTVRRDPVALHEYIFAVARPTFIMVQGGLGRSLGLYDDSRFEQDYVAICERTDVTGIGKNQHRTIRNGSYVRRDAVTNPAAQTALKQIQAPCKTS